MWDISKYDAKFPNELSDPKIVLVFDNRNRSSTGPMCDISYCNPANDFSSIDPSDVIINTISLGLFNKIKIFVHNLSNSFCSI